MENPKLKLPASNLFKGTKLVHVIGIDMGVRYLLFNQLLYLKGIGYDASAVCSAGPFVPEIRQAGIPVKTIEIKRKISPIDDLAAVWQMFLYFRRERFDIVHTHTPKAGFVGRLAAKLAGIPIIVHTVHGFYFHDNMNPTELKFHIALERMATLCCDSMLSENAEDVAAVVREGICDVAKISHIGGGIDLEEFNAERFTYSDVVAKKRELGITEKEKVVGMIGRLVKEKGFMELFEAVRAIKGTLPNVKFLVAGPLDTDKADALSPDIVKDLGLEDDVISLSGGRRTDIPELYAIMDVFALPSHREGLPRTLMEASAMAKPVVTSDIRGCREVVKDGETGILVPLKDADALAEAILLLLQDEGRARAMGQAGRRRAEELFDERKVFQRVEAEYERLLRQKLGGRTGEDEVRGQ